MIATALALGLLLSASATAPAARPVRAGPVVAAVDPVAASRIQEDPSAGSVTIVPARRNGALVVYPHGWGQDRRALLDRPEESRVARALVSAGFTMLGADAHLKAWGDPASVDDYRRLVAATARRYGLHDVFLMGESMGVLVTMQLAAQLPDVRAVNAWYPVCDLRTMTGRRFRASIDRAWRGLDRAAVSPVQASDAPMLVWASAQDTVVTASGNAAVCVARARARGARVRYIRTTGQHGARSSFSAETVVRFFQQHRTP